MARSSKRPKWALKLLLYFLAGLFAAWISVVVLDSLGVGRDVQRVAAFVCVVGALAVVFSNEELRPSDTLSVFATVVALGVASVAALGVIGSIEEVPALGCVSSDGHLSMTISAEAANVWSEATPASESTGLLLLRGCRMNFTGYCLGAVHRDALESEVRDSRWLILSDHRGLVAAGHTVGTIPADERPQRCPRNVGPPGPVRFQSAEVDAKTHRVRLFAQADRAAIIGFALQEGTSWKRLGWDPRAMDDQAVIVAFPQKTDVRAGATVAAVACIAFKRPSGKADIGRLAKGNVPASKDPTAEPSNEQPSKTSPAAAACDASVPPPP